MFTLNLKPYTIEGHKISPKDELIKIIKFWQLYISNYGIGLHKKIAACSGDQIILGDSELIMLKDMVDSLLHNHPDGFGVCDAHLNVLNTRILDSFVSELRKLHPEITAEGGELRGIGLKQDVENDLLNIS